MSSLKLKRFCSTKHTGWPSGSVNSYWLTTGRMRWRRRKTSCSFGWTTPVKLAAAPFAGAYAAAMDFGLPDELKDIRDAVRDLCARFDGAYWRGLEPDRYPEEFVAALTEH